MQILIRFQEVCELLKYVPQKFYHQTLPSLLVFWSICFVEDNSTYFDGYKMLYKILLSEEFFLHYKCKELFLFLLLQSTNPAEHEYVLNKDTIRFNSLQYRTNSFIFSTDLKSWKQFSAKLQQNPFSIGFDSGYCLIQYRSVIQNKKKVHSPTKDPSGSYCLATQFWWSIIVEWLLPLFSTRRNE